MPAADMIVVFTGNILDDVIPPTDGLVFQYILASCTDLPPEATYQTYAEYGIRFEYPIGVAVQEMPFAGQETVSSEGGMVQFQLLSYPLELVDIVWLQAEPEPDLEAYLAGYNESASQQAGVTFTVGESRAFPKRDHKARYHPRPN
jgi:hypothetical protein